MARDSTLQLEKDLHKLENRFDNQEENFERLDCFLFELNANQEEDRSKIEKLEKRVSELEVRMDKVEDDVELSVDQDALDEGDRKINLLEERISVLKIENIELRNHLNLMIDTLNSVVKILNSQVINEEPTDEATIPHEDTQHTLKKVYAKYEVITPHEDMNKDTNN